MTKYNSANFGFLTIGGYNLTPVTTKFEDNINKAAIESTPFGVVYPEYLAGILKRYELTGADGWYDDATNSMNAAMVDLTAGEHILMIAPYGNAAPVAGVGNTVIATDGLLKTEYKRSHGVGEYTKASFGVTVSGSVDQTCKLVCPLTSRGVTGTTAATYLNWGAGGTAGGRVYLVVTDISWGTRTSLQITLQDWSDAGGPFVDHTLFTAIVPATTPTGSGTSEMKVLANAVVGQYTCVTWTWGGGGAGAETVTFAVAVIFD
jgi:hypothetical protein